MAEALWVMVGAIGGAVAGAIVSTWVGRWLGRPRPALLVDPIEVTGRYLGNEAATPDDELIRECEAYILIDLGSLDVSQTVTESAYVGYLQDARDSLGAYLERTLPRTRKAADEFQTLIAREDFERAEALFARHAKDLWSVLVTHHLRGDVQLPGDGNYADRPRIHEVVSDSDGDYYIRLGGANNLVILWSPWSDGIYKKQSHDFAQRCVEAFAHHAKDDLMSLADGLRTTLEQAEPKTVSLADRLTKALVPHQRLVVTGLATNQGGTPFSIANRAKVVVRMRGYPLADARAQRGTIDDDVDVGVRIGANLDLMEEPLVVEGGKAQRFMAISEETLGTLLYGQELAEAFRSSDRTAYLVLSAILSGRMSYSPLFSGDLSFRDTALTPDLPRKS